jgi:hypothetical protein
MPEHRLDRDDEGRQKADGEANTFQKHGVEGWRDQLFEGVNCGTEHHVFQLRPRI